MGKHLAPKKQRTGRQRVAIMLDLEWPFRRHVDVFVGTQWFARERATWDCVLDEFASETLQLCRPGRAPYDGIIARATPELERQARRHGIPVVNVWYNSPARGLPGVFADFRAYGQMAAEHLLARGFRRFACLSGRGDSAQSLEVQAFHEAIQRAGFRCNCRVVARQTTRNRTSSQRFHSALDEWIASWSAPVGVFVTFPDATGRHVAAACQRHGLRIPEDAALIASDNEPSLCLHPSPSLSGVEVPYRQIGYLAAEMLDLLMQGRKPPLEHRLIAPSGIAARQSTDFLAVDDSLVAAALHEIARRSHPTLGVDDVCQAISVGRRTLERRFRRVLGRGIAAEILRLRVERAKRELAHAQTPLKQVAREAGFESAKRLHEAFAREVGLSPSQYRQQLRITYSDERE
ncbi:MAG TPA: substrate-binding domain-containing protein [Planctomycetota bacterium]|jgi:LacI family transcriptional regulator